MFDSERSATRVLDRSADRTGQGEPEQERRIPTGGAVGDIRGLATLGGWWYGDRGT